MSKQRRSAQERWEFGQKQQQALLELGLSSDQVSMIIDIAGLGQVPTVIQLATQATKSQMGIRKIDQVFKDASQMAASNAVAHFRQHGWMIRQVTSVNIDGIVNASRQLAKILNLLGYQAIPGEAGFQTTPPGSNEVIEAFFNSKQ